MFYLEHYNQDFGIVPNKAKDTKEKNEKNEKPYGLLLLKANRKTTFGRENADVILTTDKLDISRQ